MEKTLEMKQKSRAQWAWYLYDFGNSAYAAVVLLAVYAAYFKQGVVGTAQGSALWGLSLTISMLVVALISPFLGALADYSGRKKDLSVHHDRYLYRIHGFAFYCSCPATYSPGCCSSSSPRSDTAADRFFITLC